MHKTLPKAMGKKFHRIEKNAFTSIKQLAKEGRLRYFEAFLLRGAIQTGMPALIKLHSRLMKEEKQKALVKKFFFRKLKGEPVPKSIELGEKACEFVKLESKKARFACLRAAVEADFWCGEAGACRACDALLAIIARENASARRNALCMTKWDALQLRDAVSPGMTDADAIALMDAVASALGGGAKMGKRGALAKSYEDALEKRLGNAPRMVDGDLLAGAAHAIRIAAMKGRTLAERGESVRRVCAVLEGCMAEDEASGRPAGDLGQFARALSAAASRGSSALMKAVDLFELAGSHGTRADVCLMVGALCGNPDFGPGAFKAGWKAVKKSGGAMETVARTVWLVSSHGEEMVTDVCEALLEVKDPDYKAKAAEVIRKISGYGTGYVIAACRAMGKKKAIDALSQISKKIPYCLADAITVLGSAESSQELKDYAERLLKAVNSASPTEFTKLKNALKVEIHMFAICKAIDKRLAAQNAGFDAEIALGARMDSKDALLQISGKADGCLADAANALGRAESYMELDGYAKRLIGTVNSALEASKLRDALTGEITAIQAENLALHGKKPEEKEPALYRYVNYFFDLLGGHAPGPIMQ
ncbi:MAG: hypothetical protein NTX79_03190 [Candidatus Micrarchaeota archaeon]|nr:hypothetical protein [Candidatus Micrarchaeota archaeon]